MAESVLGTFRVEKELWNKFQGLAKSSGSNASQAIVGFIQACIDGSADGSIDIKNYTNIKPKQKAESENIDGAIDTYLDKNLDQLIGERLDKNLDQLIGERLDKNLDQLATMREELNELKKALGDRAVVPAIDSFAQIQSIDRSIDPLPTWVNKNNSRWYSRFADDNSLLPKVNELIGRAKDNSDLAECFISIGLHKRDGTAFDITSISNIKTVVKQLNESTTPSLPLFTNE